MATTITANGINFPDGSAGSPSIGGTDTNTGLFTGSDIVGFATGGSERLRIDASGNINIANDSGKLQLGASADLKLYHDGTNSVLSNATGTLYYLAGTQQIMNLGGTETMAKFTENAAVELYYDNSKKLETTSSGVKISDSILEIADATCLIDLMETGSTNHRLRNGSGNFYIQKISDDKGTETDQFKIDGGTGAVELYHNGSKKLETHAHGIRLNGAESGAQFQLGANNDFQIEHDGSNTYLYNLTNDLVIQNDAAVEITAKSGGTKRFRFDSDGLKFGTDTAAANALNDYEEGTWTPAISFGYNTYNQSYAYQQGQYTKIGNRVFLTCYVQFSNKGTASGVARLGGLPFSNANVNVNYAHGSAWINSWNGGETVPTGYVEVNSSNYRMERQRCDSPSTSFGVSTCDNTNFNNNTDMMLNMHYRVT